MCLSVRQPTVTACAVRWLYDVADQRKQLDEGKARYELMSHDALGFTSSEIRGI